MGLVSFAQETESPIAPGRLFKALILDFHNLYTKLMPQSIISMDIIEGDGGVGTIKQINFTQGLITLILSKLNHIYILSQ